MKFPLLIHNLFTKWLFLFIGGASTLILYQWTNRVHFTEPELLRFGIVDGWMPFTPWTVWIYFTEYLFFLLAYFGLKNYENVTRYFYSYMAILLFSILVFILYPVTFPRGDYPVAGLTLSEQALTFLRTYMDNPANCLPSLHVSSCYISSLCFWRESRTKAILLTIWSTFVAVSTMTTKQHYFVDVWTAILLTAVVYWFFFYKVDLEPRANRIANR